MMSDIKNGDMPASPSQARGQGGEFIDELSEGLTKREAFAMAAMQGICGDGIPGTHHMPNQTAADAVAQADALLKELAK